MINRVVLVGRLTKDPELKYTQSGIAVTRFTLAVNRTFSNQQGEREADFINCVTWRKQAENTANFLRKGSLTGIEGRIQTSSFDGQDGKRVFMTEVVADSVQFLEPRSNNAPSRQSNTQQNTQPNSQGQGNQYPNPYSDAAGDQQQHYSQGHQPNPYQQNQQPAYKDPFANNSGPIEVSDDDLPF
jgi:single-strand DNA-binding protein